MASRPSATKLQFLLKDCIGPRDIHLDARRHMVHMATFQVGRTFQAVEISFGMF